MNETYGSLNSLLQFGLICRPTPHTVHGYHLLVSVLHGCDLVTIIVGQMMKKCTWDIFNEMISKYSYLARVGEMHHMLQ